MDILPSLDLKLADGLYENGASYIFTLWGNDSPIEYDSGCMYRGGSYETNDISIRKKVPLINRSHRRAYICNGCDLNLKLFPKSRWFNDNFCSTLGDTKIECRRYMDNPRELIPFRLPGSYMQLITNVDNGAIIMDNVTLGSLIESYLGEKYAPRLHNMYVCGNMSFKVIQKYNNQWDNVKFTKRKFNSVIKSIKQLLDKLDELDIYAPNMTLDDLSWDGTRVRINDISDLGWKYDGYLFLTNNSMWELLPSMVVTEMGMNNMNMTTRSLLHQIGLYPCPSEYNYHMIMGELFNLENVKKLANSNKDMKSMRTEFVNSEFICKT